MTQPQPTLAQLITTMKKIKARKYNKSYRSNDLLIHSFILETYIVPLQDTTTQRHSQPSQD